MDIPYLDLKRITAMHGDELQLAAAKVIAGGWYLLGEENKRFERAYSEYIGTKHCVACANGLDSLTLILRAYLEIGALKEGDEVIVPANTYIASILAISENRLVPILVEPRIDTFQIDDRLIEQAVTNRTRAIMLVHLYGRCAYSEHIGELCKKYELRLIEDNAQAHGCTFDGKRTGSLGDAAGHSFYPGKNLGALADAGAITTDDDALSEVVRAIANYGSDEKYVFRYKGRNSRMDEMTAALLTVKLKYLDAENRRRREIAEKYVAGIHNEQIILPPTDGANHVFPVLCKRRDELQRHLADNGIGTLIHYPIPPHRQACYTELSHYDLPVTERIHHEELSLPVNQTLTDDEVHYIIDAVNRF